MSLILQLLQCSLKYTSYLEHIEQKVTIAKKIAFSRSRSLILRSPIAPRSFDQMAIADRNRRSKDRRSLMLWKLFMIFYCQCVPMSCSSIEIPSFKPRITMRLAHDFCMKYFFETLPNMNRTWTPSLAF